MNTNKEIGCFKTNLFSKSIYSIFLNSYYFIMIANCHLQCKKNIFTAKKPFAGSKKLHFMEWMVNCAIFPSGVFFAVNGEQVKSKNGSVLNA
jgi:hypothetical protein